MLLIWGANGFAQSMLWAPILVIISGIAHPSLKHGLLLAISAAAPLGTMFCYIVCGFIVGYGYKWVFIAGGAIVALSFTALLFLFLIKRKPLSAALRQKTLDIEERRAAMSAATPRAGFLKIMPLTCLIMLAAGALLQGALKDGLSTWVPAMLSEKFDINASLSSFLTIFLPVVNLSGGFIASAVNKKAGPRYQFIICAAFMAIGMLFAAPMLLPGNNRFSYVILLSVVTTAMFGFSQISIALIPQRYSPTGKVAAISGLLNALTYAGSAIASALIGFIKTSGGWNGVIILVICAALIGTIVSLIGFSADKNKKQPLNLNRNA